MIADTDCDPRDRSVAARTAGRYGRLGMLALAAAAGFALSPSAMATAPSAMATAPAAVLAAGPAAVHSDIVSDPCPCVLPACRPACSQR